MSDSGFPPQEPSAGGRPLGEPRRSLVVATAPNVDTAREQDPRGLG